MNEKTIKALLIEDDDDDVFLLRESLADAEVESFRLTHADRLSSGLECLTKEEFDVILLDLNLPDIRGLDTFTCLHTQVPHIPIVVLSGLDDETIAVEAVRQGAQDYLVKGNISGPMLVRVTYYAIERKRAEQGLRESEEHIRTLLESAPDAIVVVNGDGCIERVNLQTEKMFGYERRELIGKPLNILIPKRFGEEHKKHLERYFADPQTRPMRSDLDLFGLHRNGEEIPVEINLSPIHRQGELLIIATVRDITERKRANLLLKALNNAALAMEKVFTPDEIFSAVTNEIKALGFNCTVFLLDDNQQSVILKHHSFESKVLTAIEKLIGFKLKGYSMPLRMLPDLEKIIIEGEAVFSPNTAEIFLQWLPENLHSLIEKIMMMTGAVKIIDAPLYVENKVVGVFSVHSEKLIENDKSAISAFAYQVAASWHKAQLYEQSQLEITERKRAQSALHQSEERFRTIFQTAAVSIWEEDFTEVRAACDDLRTQGITDLRRYFQEHPEFLAQAAGMIRIVDVNEATIKMFGAKDKDELLGSLDRVFTSDTTEILSEEILAIAEGRPYFEGETINQTLQGEPIDVLLTMTIPSDPRKLDSVLVSIMDITERKKAEEQTRRNAARAEALARTASRLNAHLDLDAVLNTISEETAIALNVPASSVYLLDERTQTFCLAGAYGYASEHRDRFPPIPRSFYDEYYERSGPIVIVPNIQNIRDLPGADLYAERDIRTLVTVRLHQDGQLLGVLNISTLGKERQFTEDELALLRGLADQAALAISNARLYEETERHADKLEKRNIELARLYRASEALVFEKTPDLDKLAQSVVDIVLTEFGQSNCSLVMIDESLPHKKLRRIAVAGPFADEVSQGDLDIDGQGLVPKAIHTAEIVNTGDVRTNPDYVPNWEAARSELAIPLKVGERVIGVIDIQSADLVAFNEDDERIMSIFAERAALALENARLDEETEKRLRRLSALRNIDTTIAGAFDLKLTLNVLLEEVTKQLGVDAADVLLYDKDLLQLEYGAAIGFRTKALQFTNLRLGDGYAGKAALERRTIRVTDLREEQSELRKAPLLVKENFVSYYGVPLIAKREMRGVLEIFHRSRLDPDSDWLEFMEILAGQAAIAIDNATMFGDLQSANRELILAYDTTLEGWSNALEMRDMETEGHSRRVTEMTINLAQNLGINGRNLVHIRRGALLHDIGKMGIPDQILHKPGKLSNEEWQIMKQHPVYAHQFLSKIEFLRPALEIPYSHHEKWDGSGYPQGLKGEQIPLAARIFAVVDVWDALSSDRPYRSAWPEEEILAHIRQQTGKHFDPRVVDAFLNLLEQAT